MSSIRRFLVIVLIAGITLFNFVAALKGYQNGIDKLSTMFDEHLANNALLLSQLDLDSSTRHSITLRTDKSSLFQVWNAQQQLMHYSANAPETAMVKFEQGYHTASFDGYRWRVLVYFDNKKNYWYVVAEREDKRFSLAENIVIPAILPILFGLPLLGLLIWLVVGRGLQPLQTLAKLLSEKKSGDLQPLQLSNVPVELTQLVQSTNDLLARLEHSFDREKRFSGDAAHELRTPLSALKIHLYNLRKTVGEDNDNIRQMTASVDRMVHLIEQMLALYRTTPEQSLAKFEMIDLYKLTQAVVTERFSAIDAKQQSIELQGSSCLLEGDHFALETLIKNLLDNANKYTPEKGQILIRLIETADTLEWCIEDSGIGIPEALYERVFERFYRVHGDQHNTSVIGCGLGLSIVQHIVDLHAGTIRLQHSSFASGLAVIVSLPKKHHAPKQHQDLPIAQEELTP